MNRLIPVALLLIWPIAAAAEPALGAGAPQQPPLAAGTSGSASAGPPAAAGPVAPAAVAAPAPAASTATAPAAGATDKKDGVSLAVLLGQEPAQYNSAVRCITVMHVEKTEVLGPQLIVFRDQRHVWINQLPGRCPGLRPGVKVAYEMASPHHFCAFDGARVVNYFGGSSNSVDSFGPGCFLGKFEPITKEQLAVLREHYTPPPPSLAEEIGERESKLPKH